MATTANAAKTTYRITNWSQYNESLVRRGDVTFWFDEAVIAAWKHENAERKVGRPFVYSNLAVESLLMLRELFRLPYRQTEGLGRALARLLQADVAIPDFTSLAKRAGKTNVTLPVDKSSSGPMDIVVDSTGLKVYGEGEWKVRQHGVGKRRTWRKLHLAVNPETHEIVAQVLTDNGAHDADQVEPCWSKSTTECRPFTATAPTTSGRCIMVWSNAASMRSSRRGKTRRSSSTPTRPPIRCLSTSTPIDSPRESRRENDADPYSVDVIHGLQGDP